MSDNLLHADIAGLRADLQATNKNVERIASALEKTLDDHESRLRDAELKLATFPSREEIQEVRDFMNKTLGIGLVINFLGLAGISILVLSKGV
jgi:tetrahydromethanopterin S-methyltransferase subunit B